LRLRLGNGLEVVLLGDGCVHRPNLSSKTNRSLIALRAIKSLWRTHSCAPRPDSSGHMGRASARVPMRHARVRAPHSSRDLAIKRKGGLSGSDFRTRENLVEMLAGMAKVAVHQCGKRRGCVIAHDDLVGQNVRRHLVQEMDEMPIVSLPERDQVLPAL